MKLSGDATWYQGLNNIGFFPRGVERDAAWTNPAVVAKITGDTAFETVVNAGYYSTALAAVAEAENLVRDGYGIFGSCGDSIAVALKPAFAKGLNAKDIHLKPEFKKSIEAAGGRFLYPYLINAKYLTAQFDKDIAQAKSPEDAQVYRNLKSAMLSITDDVSSNDDASRRQRAQRALGMMKAMWPEKGTEPFEIFTHSRELLEAYLKNPQAYAQ
ncbi:MAG: hypothetical protein R3C68_09170 [Myxococcota bacterium]